MPQIHLELEGLEAINTKIESLHEKIKAVSLAADELFQETVSLQVKINQPPAGTSD